MKFIVVHIILALGKQFLGAFLISLHGYEVKTGGGDGEKQVNDQQKDNRAA